MPSYLSTARSLARSAAASRERSPRSSSSREALRSLPNAAWHSRPSSNRDRWLSILGPVGRRERHASPVNAGGDSVIPCHLGKKSRRAAGVTSRVRGRGQATRCFPRPSRLRSTPPNTDAVLTCRPPPKHRARLPPISEADCALGPPPGLSSQSESEMGIPSRSLIGDREELF